MLSVLQEKRGRLETASFPIFAKRHGVQVMASGWNYAWGESWHDYIQRSTLTDDLTAVQRESSQAVVGAISAQTASILAGHSTLGDELSQIARNLSGLDATFQWGFGRVIAELDGMSASLAELLRTAKTPVQTWAYNQFKIACDNFRRGLYENCTKRLDKAINGDQTSAGYEEEWRFHRMLGEIRLGFLDATGR